MPATQWGIILLTSRSTVRQLIYLPGIRDQKTHCLLEVQPK